MRPDGGAALLEVLLALALFVAAAAVVTAALNASLESLERQKLGVQALNLAASVVAEVELGVRAAGGGSPQPFEPPFQDWTWAATAVPVAGGPGFSAGWQRVEVVVRHQAAPVVQRFTQVMAVRAVGGSPDLSAAARPAPPAP
ncbi:MAG: hypothetical protein ACKO3N_09315 [Verrucomicrobiota bacterium]